MKRKYSLILGIFAIIVVLVLVGQSLDFFATTTGADGSVFSCKGLLYTSPAYSVSYFQDVANSCMTKDDVVCEAGKWSTTSNYFQCFQICYMCDGTKGIGFNVDYDCQAHGGKPLDHDDMKAYYITDTLSDADISAKYCAPPPPPPPPPNMVNCYTCVNDKLVTQQYSSCPSGWSTSRPTCEVTPPPQTITCYKCDVVTNQLISQELLGTVCPLQYTSTQPNCNIKNVTCYQCISGVITTDSFAESCPNGWDVYDEEQATCGSFLQWFKDLIDFEEKPVSSGILIGAILLLLLSIFFTVKDLRSNSSSRGF